LSESFRKNKTAENLAGRRSIPETSTNVVLGATFDVCRLQSRGVSSGLQRRFIFYAAEKHGRFIPCPPPPNKDAFAALVGMFRELCQFKAECRFSKEALEVWGTYQRHNRELLGCSPKEAS